MIVMTAFAARRHFDPLFAGTTIPDMTPDEFTLALNYKVSMGKSQEAPGYAPFCKHLFVENFTEAEMGVAPITDTTRPLLKVGYKARRPGELPVLETWFDREEIRCRLLMADCPWLDVVLYSRDQLALEDVELPEGAEWGIVAILSAPTPEEAPMKPITMMRNALGKDQGGSGVPLDADAYARAVAYWSNRATVEGV